MIFVCFEAKRERNRCSDSERATLSNSPISVVYIATSNEPRLDPLLYELSGAPIKNTAAKRLLLRSFLSGKNEMLVRRPAKFLQCFGKYPNTYLNVITARQPPLCR